MITPSPTPHVRSLLQSPQKKISSSTSWCIRFLYTQMTTKKYLRVNNFNIFSMLRKIEPSLSYKYTREYGVWFNMHVSCIDSWRNNQSICTFGKILANSLILILIYIDVNFALLTKMRRKRSLRRNTLNLNSMQIASDSYSIKSPTWKGDHSSSGS